MTLKATPLRSVNKPVDVLLRVERESPAHIFQNAVEHVEKRHAALHCSARAQALGPARVQESEIGVKGAYANHLPADAFFFYQ